MGSYQDREELSAKDHFWIPPDHNKAYKSPTMATNTFKSDFMTLHLIAARAPCHVFDPWVRWARGQVGIREFVRPWRRLENWELGNASRQNADSKCFTAKCVRQNVQAKNDHSKLSRQMFTAKCSSGHPRTWKAGIHKNQT